MLERVPSPDLPLESKEPDIVEILQEMVEQEKWYDHGNVEGYDSREHMDDNVDGILIPDPHLAQVY